MGWRSRGLATVNSVLSAGLTVTGSLCTVWSLPAGMAKINQGDMCSEGGERGGKPGWKGG